MQSPPATPKGSELDEAQSSSGRSLLSRHVSFWRVAVENLFGSKDDGEEEIEDAPEACDSIPRAEWLARYRSFNKDCLVFVDEDRPYPELKESSRRIIFNLLGFLTCREAVDATAQSVLPRSYMDQFASFQVEDPVQQRPRGGAPVCSYDALLHLCRPALPNFEALMRSIVTAAGLDPDAPAMHDGLPLRINDERNFTAFTLAPLKGQARCDEKARNEYHGEYGRIVDCVRCSIVVDTEQQLLDVSRQLANASAPLEALAEPADSGCRGPARFVLLRLKNRYREPLFNGYRDGLYSIAVSTEDGGWVVCEVQLHLGAILAHKKASHAYYEFFRRYFRGASEAIEVRLTLLSKIGTAPSPDALLYDVLEGEDETRLAALGTLSDVEMLADYALQIAVRKRRLELLLAAKASDVQVAEMQQLLACAYWRNQQCAESEPICREALATRKRVFGLEDEETLKMENLLAHVLKDTERYDEAEKLYRYVLETRRQVRGEAHAATLTSMNNLAVLLAVTKRYKAAEQLYRETLLLRRQVLGNEDRGTLLSIYLLATLLEQTECCDEAEALYREVLETRRQILGEEHPETLQARERLASLLKRLGRRSSNLR